MVDFFKLAFAQKRKNLSNNLRVRYSEAVLKAALNNAKIKPTIRAEALSLEQMASLVRALALTAALAAPGAAR